MATVRTLTIDYGCPTEVLYVMGTELSINLYRTADPKAKFFSVTSSSNMSIIVPNSSVNYLNEDSTIFVSMKSASKEKGDGKVTIQLYDSAKKELESADLIFTAIEISLDVDANQDGEVEKNNPNKGSWEWGPQGHGAILLVSCDAKLGKRPDYVKTYIASVEELKDMSPMVLRTAGPEKLPEGYSLMLYMEASDAQGARVYLSDEGTGKENFYPLVLDSGRLAQKIDYKNKETNYLVQGIKFSDIDFSGLVRIHLSVLKAGAPETVIFTDTVQFKLAPFIMTPNTQAPLKVYVCGTKENVKFIEGIKDLAKKAGCEHQIIPEGEHHGDVWARDEMKFGYIESPQYHFPVVLESPRDRGLENFVFDNLLGPDFGYVTKHPPRDQVSSLDSFGNLMISPPVTVKGRTYPLGRIINGGAFPFQKGGRHTNDMVRNFLRAQVVQEPIALFSDWLGVGHVDEFISFVPANDKKGFRLLMASPHAAYKLFRRLQEEGHGQAELFDGCPDPNVQKVTVDDLLANKTLHATNDYNQRCIDWNRDRLKIELGLDETDIVDIPTLFQLVEREDCGIRATAYFPGMVNMLVLGTNLGIAKPFGPRVDNQCSLETEVRRLLEPLGLTCNFIDDFVVYHEDQGEVHCGSNTHRKEFDFKWWKMEMGKQ